MALCLVTGGAGFIGSHLVEALLTCGDQVRVLDNLSTGYQKNLSGVIDKIEFIKGDIGDPATVEQAVKGINLIFHLAGMVSVPKSMENPIEAELTNTVGTLNILQATKAAGVRRVIFSSSCAVYGDEPTLPKAETAFIRPKSPYAVSKLNAEAYCRLFNDTLGLETVIFRYFNVFGPRQDPSSVYSGVISIFVDKLSRDIAPFIYGDGEQTRDFVFVSDVVRANLLAAEVSAAAGKTFNIGAGHEISINRLYKSLSHILGRNLSPVYNSARPGDIVRSYSNPALAQLVLGWLAQVPFETGLQALVKSTQTGH